MEIKKAAIAGTLESSDAMVHIEPREDIGILLKVDSVVEQQFGDEIRKVILDTVKELCVESAIISVIDKGALDCTLRARVQAAICRAGEEQFQWGGTEK